MTRHARITGTGSYLPPRKVSNAQIVDQLAKLGIESSDSWILERTGIGSRHFVDAGVYSSDLAFEASKAALSASGGPAESIFFFHALTIRAFIAFTSEAV